MEELQDSHVLEGLDACGYDDHHLGITKAHLTKYVNTGLLVWVFIAYLTINIKFNSLFLVSIISSIHFLSSY